MIASGNIAVVAGTNETSSSSSSSLPTTSSVAPVAPVAATLYETSTLSENANVAVKTDAFVKTKRHTYVNVDDNSEGGSGTATAAAAAAAATGAGAEVRVTVARAEATAPNSAVKIDTFMKSKRHTYINLDEDLVPSTAPSTAAAAAAAPAAASSTAPLTAPSTAAAAAPAGAQAATAKRHKYVNMNTFINTESDGLTFSIPLLRQNSMPAVRAGGTNLDAATPPLLVAQQQ